jgi:hypothetical protein
MSKITSLRCLNLSEEGCRAQLNRSALTNWAETLLKRGVALSEGVFIAGLGVPTPNATPLRLATGGGGVLRIRNLHDKHPCPWATGCLVEGGGEGRGGDTP